MKYTLSAIIAFSMFCAMPLAADSAVAGAGSAAAIPDDAQTKSSKQVSYLDAISFENRVVAKDADRVNLVMDIVLDSTKIKTQHTVSLTPVLVSADGTEEMPFETIIVDGRTRHKVFLRQDRLEGTDPQRDSAQAIIRRKNRSEQEYTYSSSIPYSPWMLDGTVRIDECVKGCVNCEEGESRKNLDEGVLPRYIPEWLTSRIEPEPEPVKVRAESREARLQFRWDKYDILPDFKDNRTVLDTVTNSIDLVKGVDYITIQGVYVSGYASPEGTYEYNMRLSRNRAESFAKYISAHNDIPDSLMTVEWGGEDWAGFREQLVNSSFAKKDRVIEVIDKYTEDRNLCERKMLNLMSRAEYVWLLRNIYPYLRHCNYRVEYAVRNFDLEEARQIIHDRPQDLSLSEMYKVAGSYEKGSDEYNFAMETAARFYPDRPSVMGDTAIDAIEAEDAARAISILEEKVPEDQPELMNALGVAYAMEEEYDLAREAFNSAKDAGSENAAHNLVELLNVMNQL